MRLASALAGALLLVGSNACPAVRPPATTSSTSTSASTAVAPKVTPSSAAATGPEDPTPDVTLSQTSTWVPVGNRTTFSTVSRETAPPSSSAGSSSASLTVSPSAEASSTGTSEAVALTSTAAEASVTSTSEDVAAATTSSTEASLSSTTAQATWLSSPSSAGPSPTLIHRAYPADAVDKLQDSSISKLEAYLQQNPAGSCTLESASVRQEWSDMSVEMREAYIAAIQCLMSKDPISNATEVPGARSRFDDIVATHISQTDYIHNTANFLSWHRYYVWAHEKALREECGYTGHQPYWNWDRYYADPESSPLFNGNASSIGGNGVDGGCVATGPFKDIKVNLGPGGSLAYNPRCLKRDISRPWALQTKADKTHALITGSADVEAFQTTLQASHGVHAGGHFTVGGDPGGDVYSSPGDPYFFLHHAMVDRVWWIWQMQDLEARLREVAGPVAGSDRGGGLADTVQLGVNGGAVAIADLMSTTGGLAGAMCYIYL